MLIEVLLVAPFAKISGQGEGAYGCSPPIKRLKRGRMVRRIVINYTRLIYSKWLRSGIPNYALSSILLHSNLPQNKTRSSNSNTTFKRHYWFLLFYRNIFYISFNSDTNLIFYFISFLISLNYIFIYFSIIISKLPFASLPNLL